MSITDTLLGIEEPSGPVTISLKNVVPPRKLRRFREWQKGILASNSKHPNSGFLGATLIEEETPEGDTAFLAILRYSSPLAAKTWSLSEEVSHKTFDAWPTSPSNKTFDAWPPSPSNQTSSLLLPPLIVAAQSPHRGSGEATWDEELLCSNIVQPGSSQILQPSHSKKTRQDILLEQSPDLVPHLGAGVCLRGALQLPPPSSFRWLLGRGRALPS